MSDHRQTPEYAAAVKAAADRITLSAEQRARLAILLDPVRQLRAAVAARPDLPVGIVREAVVDDAA